MCIAQRSYKSYISVHGIKGVSNVYFQQMLEIKASVDELKTSQNSVFQRIEQFCTSQEKVQECKW